MMKMKKRIFPAAAAAILLFAAAMRLIDFFAPLAYDEIWSLKEYAPLPAGRILTDLGLPNNHPLNSLWMKFLLPASGPIPLRLLALASGLAAVMLAGIFARRWFGSRVAALFAMLCLAFSAPAIAYSDLARGYAPQLAALLLFALSLAALKPPCRHPALAALGLLAGGAGAILSVSSAAIFLLPMGLAALVFGLVGIRRSGAKPYLLPMAAFGAFSLLALGWYAFHAATLRQGMIWGTALDSPAALLRWSGTLLDDLGIPWFLMLLCAAPVVCRRGRARWLPLLAALLLPLALAPLTRGGPARVYLPLAAAFALLYGGTAALVLRRLRRAPLLRLFAAALAVLIPPLLWRQTFPRWEPVDWPAVAAAAEAAPPDTLVIYTATDDLPLVWNVPEAPEAACKRMLAPDLRQLLLVRPREGISGLTREGAETVVPLPLRPAPPLPGDLPAAYGRLRPLASEPAPGAAILALLRPASPEAKGAAARLLETVGTPLFLNARLVAAINRRTGNNSPTLIFFIYRPADGTSLPEIERAADGLIRFYEITP